MTYPRRCPLCSVDSGVTRVEHADHATLRSGPGGTPSPWRPELPGRILRLRCLACGGEYAWDDCAVTSAGAETSAAALLPRGAARDARRCRRAG